MTSLATPVRALPSLHRLAPVAAALLLCATASLAQFKVVGPDGKVTYSDREPSGSEGRVTALGAHTPQQAAEAELPFELRQVVAKYPVTLYTTSNACEPCSLARQLLKQRGIPFSERQVVTSEDSDALERIAGSHEAPTLTIGSQTLRGLTNETWNQYLDAAGYPRDSRLPTTYQYRPAAPIVDRREPTVARNGDVAPAVPVNRSAPSPAPGAPGGIRF